MSNIKVTSDHKKSFRVRIMPDWPPYRLNYRPILVLLGLGLLLRVISIIGYFPGIMFWFDSIRYARIEPRDLFGDFWMPAGYPIFLTLLRGVTRQIWFTIAVQHMMGLGAGMMLFLSTRRLGAPDWIASIPAVVVFLSGDHLYFEHLIMADSYLIFLTAAGLSAGAYALTNRANLLWLCAASVLLALAALARSVGVVLLPILVVCTVGWVRGSARERANAVAAAALPGIMIFALYGMAFVLTNGKYLGFTDMRGWNLYGRVAPFADCQRFSVPQDTAILCEERPVSQRPGPFGYVWDLNSAARRNFELGPTSGRKLEAFAWQVITNQPAEYLRAVLIDLARYIEPSIGGSRAYSGQPRETLSFGWRDVSNENFVIGYLKKKYHGTNLDLRWQGFLDSYQRLFRLGGLVLASLIGLTFAGMICARGKLRLGIFLFGLSGLALYVVPVATVSYDFRYGIPAETFVVVSGLLGAVALRATRLKTLNDAN